MMRLLLLGAFVGLMADTMFGWALMLVPGVSLKNALLYLILLTIGIEATFKAREFVLDFPQIHLFFGLFLVVSFLSWAANTFVGMYVEYSPITGLMAWKGLVLDHYMFFLLFYLGIRSRGEVLWIQKWMLFFIVLGNIATVMDAYNVPDLGFIETRHDGRVEGPMGQANSYGLFLAIFLPIIVARAWSERGAWRWIFSIGSVVTLWGLVLTVSRGSYVALIGGSLFAAFFLRDRLNARHVMRVLAVGALAVSGAILVLGQQYITLITERTVVAAETGDMFELTSGRTWIWSTALNIMMSEPWSFLTGYGWNTTLQTLGIAMHNFYLWRFFELGVFGLLALVGLFYAILYWSKQAVLSSRANEELMPHLIGFIFGFSALLVGLFPGDFFSPWYFLWAYAGLAMRMASLVLHGDTREATLAGSNRRPDRMLEAPGSSSAHHQ